MVRGRNRGSSRDHSDRSDRRAGVHCWIATRSHLGWFSIGVGELSDNGLIEGIRKLIMQHVAARVEANERAFEELCEELGILKSHERIF